MFVSVWGSIWSLWRSDPLVLELQVVASLGTELESSVRAARALNLGTISLATQPSFLY